MKMPEAHQHGRTEEVFWTGWAAFDGAFAGRIIGWIVEGGRERAEEAMTSTEKSEMPESSGRTGRLAGGMPCARRAGGDLGHVTWLTDSWIGCGAWARPCASGPSA